MVFTMLRHPLRGDFFIIVFLLALVPRFSFCVIESRGTQVHLNAINVCFRFIGRLLCGISFAADVLPVHLLAFAIISVDVQAEVSVASASRVPEPPELCPQRHGA